MNNTKFLKDKIETLKEKEFEFILNMASYKPNIQENINSYINQIKHSIPEKKRNIVIKLLLFIAPLMIFIFIYGFHDLLNENVLYLSSIYIIVNIILILGFGNGLRTSERKILFDNCDSLENFCRELAISSNKVEEKILSYKKNFFQDFKKLSNIIDSQYKKKKEFELFKNKSDAQIQDLDKKIQKLKSLEETNQKLKKQLTDHMDIKNLSKHLHDFSNLLNEIERLNHSFNEEDKCSMLELYEQLDVLLKTFLIIPVDQAKLIPEYILVSERKKAVANFWYKSIKEAEKAGDDEVADEYRRLMEVDMSKIAHLFDEDN